MFVSPGTCALLPLHYYPLEKRQNTHSNHEIHQRQLGILFGHQRMPTQPDHPEEQRKAVHMDKVVPTTVCFCCPSYGEFLCLFPFERKWNINTLPQAMWGCFIFRTTFTIVPKCSIKKKLSQHFRDSGPSSPVRFCQLSLRLGESELRCSAAVRICPLRPRVCSLPFEVGLRWFVSLSGTQSNTQMRHSGSFFPPLTT